MSTFVNRLIVELAVRDPGAHVVGGAVRDRLLGRDSLDLDVTVSVPAEPLASQLADALGARFVPIDAARGHFRLVPRKIASGDPRWVDMSAHGDDLIADLQRRDFTVDAVAVPVAVWMTAEIASAAIDPLGGIDDLKRRIIRHTSAGSIPADPLRALRGVRLAALLGFGIDPATEQAIRASAPGLGEISPARVRDELFAVFTAPDAMAAMRMMDRLGLLEAVLPEVVQGRGVTQPAEHYWDVFTHNLETVGAVSRLLDDRLRRAEPVLEHVPWREGLGEHFGQVVADGQKRSTLLKFAALVHDVAKPEMKTVEPGGRIRFIGHDERGSEVVARMLRRLRCSRRTIAHVSTMVKKHMRPGQLSDRGSPPSTRAIFRYYRDLGDIAIDTLYLSLADYLAARGPRLDAADWRSYCEMVGDILGRGFDERPDSKPSLLLNGNDIQRLFHLPPGPEIGRLLNLLHEAEASGRVHNRTEARELLHDELQRRGKGRGRRE